MKNRQAKISRNTRETRIGVSLNLDGHGKSSIKTGIPFFDHMLALFAKHATVDLKLHCQGDLEVDAHHTVEDCGIALGQAFALALGDKKGLRRYGSGFHPKNPFTGEAYVPMDECLARCVIDFGGRPHLAWRGLDAFSQKRVAKSEKLQDMSSTFRFGLAREFFQGFTNDAALQPAPGTALRRRAASYRRGSVQGVCPRNGRGLPARPTHRRPVAEHQGKTVKHPDAPLNIIRLVMMFGFAFAGGCAGQPQRLQAEIFIERHQNYGDINIYPCTVKMNSGQTAVLASGDDTLFIVEPGTYYLTAVSSNPYPMATTDPYWTSSPVEITVTNSQVMRLVVEPKRKGSGYVGSWEFRQEQ